MKRAAEPRPFNPPKRYEIDVTRGLRRMLRTGPAHGFGVRIVPNRGVDDGWTVRFTPLKDAAAELVVELYEEGK